MSSEFLIIGDMTFIELSRYSWNIWRSNIRIHLLFSLSSISSNTQGAVGN